LLSFAYVYFFESRRFNGLRAFEVKNFPAPFSSQSQAHPDPVHRPAASALDPAMEILIAQIPFGSNFCGYF
jgi:hypothetical protein